jgi:hypothetical protein
MLIRNKGLELPVFSRWTPVAWTSDEIRARARTGVDTFVRRTTLRCAGAVSLKGALQIADDIFNRAAEHANIEVVEHIWGLSLRRPSHKARKYEHWRLRNDLVPQGYSLVAQVANLAPLVEPDTNTYHTVCEALNDFHNSSRIPAPKMSELHIGAVGFRQIETGNGLALRGVILDIDPYLL